MNCTWLWSRGSSPPLPNALTNPLPLGYFKANEYFFFFIEANLWTQAFVRWTDKGRLETVSIEYNDWMAEIEWSMRQKSLWELRDRARLHVSLHILSNVNELLCFPSSSKKSKTLTKSQVSKFANYIELRISEKASYERERVENHQNYRQVTIGNSEFILIEG